MYEVFNRRLPLPHKLVDEYITNFFCLADKRNCGTVREAMKQDFSVVGLNGRLQMSVELTLDKAIYMTRNTESVHYQQNTLHDPGSTVEIDEQQNARQRKTAVSAVGVVMKASS